jgi:putative flippase GtrA
MNTAASYALFLVLELVLMPALAYTIAFAAGIALGYFINAGFVFRSGRSLRTATRYPLVYAGQYIWGLGLLSLLGGFGVPPALAMIAVIATSVPLTFLLTRHLLTSRSGAAPH